MNLSRVKLVADHPTHYEMNDGKSSFRVAKSGLSEEMHQKIRSMGEPMADGGKVKQPDADFLARHQYKSIEQLRRERERDVEAEETGRQLSEDEITRRIEKKNQRLTGEKEFGPPDQESKLEKFGRTVGDFASKYLPSMASKASGVAKYADGGAVDAGYQAPVSFPFNTALQPQPTGRPQPMIDAGTQPPAPFALPSEGAPAGGVPTPGAVSMPTQRPVDPNMVEIGLKPNGEPLYRPALQPPPELPPGLRLKSEQQQPDSQQPAVSQQTPSLKIGGGDYGKGLMRQATSDASAAAQAKGEAEAEQARATMKALGAAEEQMKANALEQKALVDKARLQSNGMLERMNQAVDEMSKIDTSVDPDRYWASKSTGQKVLGIIGLCLGAVGAGNDGVNKAAVMLSKNIDRDIEAQKAEVSARLAKGDRTLSGIQNMYAMSHQIFGDELAATAAANATALGIVNNKLQQVAASSASPIAKANADALSAQLLASRAQFEQKAGELGMEAQWRQLQALAAMSKPGPGAVADQKTVTELEEREGNIQRNAKELVGLIKAYGTQEKITPGVEARMNQLRNELVVDAAKMKDREGVVREPDEIRETKSLGFEPAFFQRDSNAIASIENFAKGSANRRAEAYRARGLVPPGGK